MFRVVPFFLAFGLLACGDAEVAETTEPSAARSPEPVPAEPTPAEPAPPVALPSAPPSRPTSGLILPATVMTSDNGGLISFEAALIRFGDGPVEVLRISANACDGAGLCTFTADRCSGTIATTVTTLPAGSWASMAITTSPSAPEHEALCARFAGTFRTGHPSDPAAGGPPPAPVFTGSECLLRPQVVSPDREVCASFAVLPGVGDAPSTNYDVTTYQGACCIGAEVAHFSIPVDVPSAFLSRDGRAIVVQRHELSVTREELAEDPVLFWVVRPDRRHELHLSELFAGDPLLTAGSGFGFRAATAEGMVVVQAIGGAEHRYAF